MSYLLVDTSYLAFYRFFATKQWYRRAQEYQDDASMVTDPVFSEMFAKKTKDCLAEIVKKYQIPWSHVIFARDCPRSEIWRLQHCSDYKGSRVDQTNCRSSFYQIREIIMDLIRSHDVKCLSVPQAEADDIVSVCHRFLREQDSETRCYILASDTDYFQLLDSHTKLVRLDRYDPMKTFGGDPQVELLAKIIGGDTSDNIPKCFAKCGKKTAMTLAQHPSQLSARLAQDPVAQSQFKLNQLLIDFRSVPEELQQLIEIKLMVSLGYL